MNLSTILESNPLGIRWIDDGILYRKPMEFISSWSHRGLSAYQYVCGHCGLHNVSIVGFVATHRVMSGPSNLDREAYIYICSNCSRPTLVVPDQPYSPRPKPGDNVPNLPEPVAKLYDEIRASIQAGAYTGAILLARTLINHVAFDQCGTEGTFKKQIEALDKERLLPKGSKEWVDEMKDIGNEVTHELKICDPETAEHVLSFTHMLLSLVYDFPNRVPKPPI